MAVKVITYTLGAFAVHSYLVLNPDAQEALLIDAGEAVVDAVKADLAKYDATLKALIFTHAHIDHVQGVAALQAEFPNVPVTLHQEERFWLQLLPDSAEMYGFEVPDPPKVTQWLNNGLNHTPVLNFDWIQFEARFCPGHTPGGISYYSPAEAIVFTGDSLFSGSIGRTDFPRGNHQELLYSIQQQLLSLPDETKVYSGHGPVTTIGQERLKNPFLQGLSV